jgi:hypothetical protein
MLLFVSMFLILGAFESGKVVVEAVEGLLPVAAVALDPFGYFLERGGIEPAWTPLSLAAARNEAGALQNLEVFGDGRCTDRKGLGEFLDGSFSEGKASEDGAARGI